MENNKEKYIHIFGIIVFSLTFVILLIIYGICYTPDSYGYLAMDIIREPVYPLFLAILRKIFGEEVYPKLTVIFQILLAVYAVFSFCKNITKRFNIKGRYIVCVYLLLYVYYFMALPLYMIIKLDSPLVTFPLTILTEGVTYSLYLLYIKSLILAGCDGDYKNLSIAMGYACLMSLIRAGLMPTIIATVIVGIYISITRKNKIKKSITVFGMGILAFVFIFIFENVYFFIVHGCLMTHTYGSVTTLSNIMYTADETDKDKIEDESLKEIFIGTYKEMCENSCGYNVEPCLNLIERGIHIEKCHDFIKFTAFGNSIGKKYDELNIVGGIEKGIYNDNIARKLSKILLKAHVGRWLEGYISLCIQGYIRTVAYAPQSLFMRVFTCMVTILYIGGLVLLRKNKDIITYLLITLLSIFGIVLSTSLVIMCMTRYMVYNFVVFYTGFIIMWCNRKECLDSIKSKVGKGGE
nr:hypothetical protein [uncultured Catonella sp.]